MRVWLALFLAFPLVACGPGYVNSDGQYVMGTSASADEWLWHPPYPDYPTWVVYKEYIGDLSQKFPTKKQQVCAVRAVYVQLPEDLQQELDDFATSERTFRESEYVALQKRAQRY